MKIIASYNIKGGVGKTTTTVNLAYLCARQGARVLIWDLDPQGASSFYFRVKPKIKGGVKKLFKFKNGLEDHIKGTDFTNIDILPADFSYRNMDFYLEAAGKPQKKLLKLLKSVSQEYDYVFLDCPPSFTMVSESVFYASDVMLIPTIPTTLSLRTLDQILKYSDWKTLKDLRMLPFFSMVDRRKNMHRLITDNPPKMDIHFLRTGIPYSSDIERMGLERQPISVYSPGSKSAQCYESLWEEIRLELN